MKRILFAAAAVLAMTATMASAQNTTRRASSSSSYQKEPRVDLIGMLGYAWTLSMDAWVNNQPVEFDIKDEMYYGGAMDITVSPPGSMKTAQVRLLYRREDSEVEVRGLSYNYTQDATVEYWHIGAVSGLQKGKSMPFGTLSLGGTRLASGDIDEWKFSMIFGLGVKVYTSPKVGILLQANWPITFTDTWGGAYVGTGGGGVSVGGTGISQLDLGGGLMLRF